MRILLIESMNVNVSESECKSKFKQMMIGSTSLFTINHLFYCMMAFCIGCNIAVCNGRFIIVHSQSVHAQLCEKDVCYVDVYVYDWYVLKERINACLLWMYFPTNNDELCAYY